MNQDFKEFFKSLNAHGVEFLIVGGVAYNFYAPPRATKDIDVWVEPRVANLQKFLEALTEFGFPHQLNAGELSQQDKVLMLGRPPNRIDVMTRPDGVDWADCWASRIVSDYDGALIAFLSLERLIQSKRAAARDQDLVDVKMLERIARSRKRQP